MMVPVEPGRRVFTIALLLPSLVTLLGTSLSLWWLAFTGTHPLFGLLGLALDAVDGRLARWLGQETRFGAELDFLSDIVIAGLCLALAPLYRNGAYILFACLALVTLGAFARVQGHRISGRTAVMLPALVHDLLTRAS